MSAEFDTPSIEENHVRLILLQAENSSFHLDIPLATIQSLCLRPLKYLRFLGWCIFGVEGVLARESDGDAIDTDGDLQAQEIYYYVRPDNAGAFSLTMPLPLCAQHTYDAPFV
jgi:hypothetical protein